MSNRISEQIKNLRQQKGWTQNELGEKVGYSPQTISAWERGQNQPDLQAISALCKLFDVTSDQLLGIEKTAQKTPPTFSEINAPTQAPKPQQPPSDCDKIVDSFEKDSGASTALKILLSIYAGILSFVAVIALVGRGDFAFLIILLTPLAIPFLDIAILIMFFIAKEKRHKSLFWIYVAVLIAINILGIFSSRLPQWLQVTLEIISIACSLVLPFLFYLNNDSAPTFLNYLKSSKLYYLALFFQLIVNIFSTEATVGYIFVFLLFYPLSFAHYITLYYATKNTKQKYFYDTVRHKEQSSSAIYQSKVSSTSKLGSAYARSTMAEDERKRTNALPYASTPHNPDASCVYKEIADEKRARVADFLVEKPVLSTVFLVLLLTLNIPVMLIVGNIYPPDNVLFYFSIILVFFSIIPTFNTLCYLFFRQGSKKLRVTLCAVYTFCSIFLNAVFFEYTFNYYIPSTLVVLAMLGVGAISIVQLFSLSDHDYLSVSARVTLKVSYTFIESIVLVFLTYLYLVAETHQVAILLLVWWQLIFFSICCTLKAPLTKQVVNYIYR